jgi:predicted lipid-binding transport protein (Tim44 family)
MKTFWLAIIAVFAAMTIGLSDAEARRAGGGMSIGKQAPVQRQATPPAQQQAPAAAPNAAQSPQAASAARPGAAAAAPAAAGSRWMGPIAGLAAGLGLAALASYLGFGEALANIMLMVLLAVVAFVVIRMIMARRAGGQSQPAYAAGNAGGGNTEFRAGQQPWSAPAPTQPAYGSAGSAATAPVAGLVDAGVNVPAEFDSAGFVHNAKVYFVRLQAAFDAEDKQDLREFTSPEMFAELKLQIDGRKGERSQTDVLTLDGTIASFQQDDHEYMVSVLFTGLIREATDSEAKAFEEVWNFTKPVAGQGGWVLAGIHQLSAH